MFLSYFMTDKFDCTYKSKAFSDAPNALSYLSFVLFRVDNDD